MMMPFTFRLPHVAVVQRHLELDPATRQFYQSTDDLQQARTNRVAQDYFQELVPGIAQQDFREMNLNFLDFRTKIQESFLSKISESLGEVAPATLLERIDTAFDEALHTFVDEKYKEAEESPEVAEQLIEANVNRAIRAANQAEERATTAETSEDLRTVMVAAEKAVHKLGKVLRSAEFTLEILTKLAKRRQTEPSEPRTTLTEPAIEIEQEIAEGVEAAEAVRGFEERLLALSIQDLDGESGGEAPAYLAATLGSSKLLWHARAQDESPEVLRLKLKEIQIRDVTLQVSNIYSTMEEGVKTVTVADIAEADEAMTAIIPKIEKLKPNSEGPLSATLLAAERAARASQRAIKATVTAIENAGEEERTTAIQAADDAHEQLLVDIVRVLAQARRGES